MFPRDHDRRPIALVGLMGAGKSAVARILGDRLSIRVADLDAWLEEEAGCSVTEMFARHGEAAFRRREGELLDRALASGAEVVACGGGVVLDPTHRNRLREDCRTAWLEVAPAEAARRVARDRPTRPLLGGRPAEERLAELLRERAPLYQEVALVRISTDARSPEEVADLVAAALEIGAP